MYQDYRQTYHPPRPPPTQNNPYPTSDAHNSDKNHSRYDANGRKKPQLVTAEYANEHRQPHPSKAADEAHSDTRPTSGQPRKRQQCRKFQRPYIRRPQLQLQEGAVEIWLLLNTPTHWRLHAVFDAPQLKPSKADRMRERPPAPAPTPRRCRRPRIRRQNNTRAPRCSGPRPETPRQMGYVLQEVTPNSKPCVGVSEVHLIHVMYILRRWAETSRRHS